MRTGQNCQCMRSSTSGRCVSFGFVAIVLCLSYRLFSRLKGGPVAQCVHNVLESSVKGLRIIKGLVEQAICQLSTV
jgi:hypothetical protein